MTREEEDKILAFIEANRPKLVASIREYFKDRLLADPRAETNHWDLVADWRQWVAQQKADMDAALEVAEYNHNFANLFPEATGVNRLGTYNARRSFPVRILYTEEEQSRQQITLFLEAVMDPESPWCLSYLDYLAWVKAELPSGTVALDKEAFQKTVAYFQSKQETSK